MKEVFLGNFYEQNGEGGVNRKIYFKRVNIEKSQQRMMKKERIR